MQAERLTLITQQIRTWLALFLASLLAHSILASAAPPTRRARAQTAYDHALRLQETLESQPEDARQKAKYEELIRALREVYRTDPAYVDAPLALGTAAGLYAEMGRVFSSDHHYHASIQAYQFLMREYPQHRLSHEALLRIGEIYRADLGNPKEAKKAFQKFLEQHPKSEKAAEAREKLSLIDQKVAESAPRPAAPPRTEESKHAERTPQVVAVNRWGGPQYNRIVIGVEDEVKFDTLRLTNPDRIVFDLANTHLSHALVGKTFPVDDGFLRQVRIAQFKPDVTRVVLDLDKMEDYSVFYLPNPFRLVIEIQGKTPAVTAAGPSPSIPGPAPSSPGLKGPATSSQEKEATSETRKSSAGPAPVSTAATYQTERGKQTAAKSALRQPQAETSKSAADSALVSTAVARQPERGEEAAGPAKETASTTTESADQSPSGSNAPTQKPKRGKETAAKSSPRQPQTAAPRPSIAPDSRQEALRVKPAAPTESGSRTLTRALGLKVAKILIDPGHGGHDTGTIGPGGLREKDLVLDVGLRLKKLIEQDLGSTVVMTRGDDEFISLEERTAVANQNAADLFISIHANASRDRKARGIETYYLNFTSNAEALEVAARENAASQKSVHELQDLIKKIATTEKIEESHEFAREVQREVLGRLAKGGNQQRDRGVKKAPFVVLIGANMPSILTEISFLTNPRDERLLKRQDYRQKIAVALYQGLTRYMSNLGGIKVAQKAHLSEPPAEFPAREPSPASRPDF